LSRYKASELSEYSISRIERDVGNYITKAVFSPDQDEIIDLNVFALRRYKGPYSSEVLLSYLYIYSKFSSSEPELLIPKKVTHLGVINAESRNILNQLGGLLENEITLFPNDDFFPETFDQLTSTKGTNGIVTKRLVDSINRDDDNCYPKGKKLKALHQERYFLSIPM
jgi:hypothetical protein